MTPDTNTTILALHESGHTTRQIEALIGGLDHSTIARRLKHLTPRKTTQIYRELRADVLAEKQRQLLMRRDSGEPLSPRQEAEISTAWKNYYQAERLERDQTTANVGVGVALSSGLQELVSRVIDRDVIAKPSITLEAQVIDIPSNDVCNK